MKLPSNWKDIRVPVAYSVAVVVGVLGGYTWLHSTFASKGDVVVAGAKADYALDVQMRGIIAEIQRIEAKKVKDAYDISQLNFLRGELERLRQLRSGK